MLQFKRKKWEKQELSTEKLSIKSLKVATLNVLFDHRQKHILYSEERYDYIIKLVEKLDSDVIGFNEVTINFLNKLKSSDFIQKNYYIFGWSEDDETSLEGNVLISKYPFCSIEYKTFDTFNRYIPIGTIQLDESKIVFCSTHFTAGPHKSSTRKYQVELLTDYLEKNYQKCCFLIFGDLNFVYENEDNYFNENYCDIWKKLKPNEDGYTFCSVTNHMIYEKLPLPFYFQKRFDRFMIKSNIFEPKSINLWANESMYQTKKDESPDYIYYIRMPLKSITAYISDLTIGVNLWRNKEEYLFPSDHFGIITEIAIKNE